MINKEYSKKLLIDECLNRLHSIFKYRNLPDSLPQVEIEKILLNNGVGFIFELSGSVVIQSGSLSGFDIYGNPTEISINNPYINLNKTFNINDGILIRNDFTGTSSINYLNDIIDLIVESNINLLNLCKNLRITNIFSASDSKTLESVKYMLKKSDEGEPSVVADNPILESFKVHNVQNVDANGIINLDVYLRGLLDRKLGLTRLEDKKERLLADEVKNKVKSDILLIESMFLNRFNSIQKVNRKFGLNITIEKSDLITPKETNKIWVGK